MPFSFNDYIKLESNIGKTESVALSIFFLNLDNKDKVMKLF